MSKTHDVASLTNSAFQVFAREMQKNGINVYGTNSTDARKFIEAAVAVAITNVPYVGDDREAVVEFSPSPAKKPTIDEAVITFQKFMDENEFTEEERIEATASLYLDEVATEEDFNG